MRTRARIAAITVVLVGLSLHGCSLFVKPATPPAPSPSPAAELDANAQLSHDAMVGLAAKYAAACDQISAKIKLDGKITRNDTYTIIASAAAAAMKPETTVFIPVNKAIESKIDASDTVTDATFFDSLSAGYKSLK